MTEDPEVIIAIYTDMTVDPEIIQNAYLTFEGWVQMFVYARFSMWGISPHELVMCTAV